MIQYQDNNKFVKLSRKNKYLSLKEAKTLLVVLLKNGMFVKPTSRSNQRTCNGYRIPSTATNNSCWTGWRISQLTGQSVGGAGIALRFQFGMLIMEQMVCAPAGKYVQPWRESPPDESEVLDRNTRKILGHYGELKEKLGDVIGEQKVFDTWMDSSNSNLFVSEYLNDMNTFEKAFPTAIRPQGKEIVRTWLYYTLLKSALLLDKGFKHVWIDGLGMDPWGRRCPNLWAMELMRIVC